MIVFTNGCFDCLHIGHMRLLKRAKALGDFLIVGLNSDESVRRLKGNDRPKNRLSIRHEMLSGVKYIDTIFIFTTDTPMELVASVKPDILVKGEDWKGKRMPEADFVRSYGGQVVFIPHEIKISTTKILLEKEKENEEDLNNLS